MVVHAYHPSVQGGGGVGEGSGTQRHSQMHSRFVVSVIIRDCIRKEVERKGRWGGGESGEEKRKGFSVAGTFCWLKMSALY